MSDLPPQGTKLYQIYTDDLNELEAIVAELAQRFDWSSGDKMKFRRCKKILSDVRWNYGPPDQVRRIEPEEPPHEQ